MGSTTEDGFHEIQLNGKQLVFLFMAATVVSVVIFLCGVLVGRGVRAERTVAQAAAVDEAPTPDILPSSPASTSAAIQAGADPRTAPPPPPVDDLTYSNRLEKSSGVTEEIKPDSAKAPDVARSKPEKPPSPPATAKSDKSEQPQKTEKAPKAEKAEKAEHAEKPAPAVAKATPAPQPAVAIPAPVNEPTPEPVAATPSPAPAGDGFAVQVAAVNARTDADAIARRFSSKGYSAYVEVPPNGTGTVFRVRIGTFKTRREAETIAAKLQKEEQIKPWVTR